MAASGNGTGGTALRVHAALTGLIALAVLLQGVWAGFFLEHDGARDAAGGWITTHMIGGDIALLLSIIATVVALVAMRPLKAVWGASLALTVLLIIEVGLGALIHGGTAALTVVHIPLALVIMALATYLPILTRRARTA
jgi:hypothetical protein